MRYFGLLLTAIAGLIISACSGTIQDRQQSADQVFGAAKMAHVLGSGLSAVYNLMPPCSDNRPPPFCYNSAIAGVINTSLEAASAAILSAEEVFAAGNTDEETRLKVAKIAQKVVEELLKNLQKFGITEKIGS